LSILTRSEKHKTIKGESIAGREHSSCKGSGADKPDVMEEQQRTVWLEQREEGSREGMGQVRQGPLGCKEDLNFDPKRGRCHGVLWVEEGRL
jgi:hypothetical protein